LISNSFVAYLDDFLPGKASFIKKYWEKQKDLLSLGIRFHLKKNTIMTNVNYNECLAYIYNKKYGYIDELESKLGDEVVRQLEAMGYIENAFDSQADTWRISERAVKRHKSITRKSSWGERISDWYYKHILRIDFNN
jgi:hypothetical protein